MKGIIRTAEGGTVFLDEVGEIPLDLQPKLLRVLQEQEVTPVGQPEPVPVDVRFLAATNSRLRQGVHDGRFRADLFHRLNVVRLVLPPLRDRPEDLPLLLEHFSQTCAQECSVPPIDFDPDVLARLKTYSWPGNVRELKCWVERVYATGLPPTVLAEMLLVEGDWQEDPEDEEAAEVISLEEAERRAIERALRHTHHRQKEAARLLKIHRTTLSRKMRDYRIS